MSQKMQKMQTMRSKVEGRVGEGSESVIPASAELPRGFRAASAKIGPIFHVNGLCLFPNSVS